MRIVSALTVALAVAAPALADDPAPTQTVSPDGNGYHAPIGVNAPFPDANYGADHGGSALTLQYPFTSPFGNPDHSRGQFVYTVAPFYPRGSEGVFGMDVWLEQEDASGNWSPAAADDGVCDAGMVYEPVNTPNPGPSPSYTFTWTYDANTLPPNTAFRVFVYVYIYNQGGGSQGDFPIESWTASVGTGAADDPPRIAWTPSFGPVNPSQVTAGQAYTVSADAQDDNGNLASVTVRLNGQPFASAGGGDGYSANAQASATDSTGSYTYTAWAVDADGETSPTISWTVAVIGKSDQAPVASSDTTLTYYTQPFSPGATGGSGTGGWQFCVGGYTNWDGGASAFTGTNLGPSPGTSPGAIWVPTWMPPAPGTYAFWVARDEDAQFNASAPGGPYTLTVVPAQPVGSFDGLNADGAVPPGGTLGGSGWAADAQLGAPLSEVQIQIDGGAAGSFDAQLGGSRPDVQAANVSWGNWSPRDLTASGWSFSWTVPNLNPGTHTLTAIAYDAPYSVSAAVGSQSFTVAPPPPPSSNPAPSPPAPTAPISTDPSPAPPSAPTAPSPPPADIARIRYIGTPAILWVDPAGLLASPWPTFAAPQPVSPTVGNTALPATP